VISEHSRRWNHFWSDRVFNQHNFIQRRTNDWTRYRVGRAIRVVAWLFVLAVILAAFYHTSPAVSLFQVPVVLYRALPFIFQIAFAISFFLIQFIALFWFLSKGGIDVHYPGDLKTRFSDVWGQDAVVARVKENLIFLTDPDQIESKGGYVPGGVLLHGPPGTGKGQPVSAMVMTPTGPRRMGDLQPGDQVIGSDGRATTILEVHLLGERDLYRVGFSDGSSLLVTEDHLWHVTSRYGGSRVRSTAWLQEKGLVEADGHFRYRIPIVRPVDFMARDLALPPYLLGALLGDGTFRHQLEFSSSARYVIARVRKLLPEGDALYRRSRYDWSIIGGATKIAIKELGLWDHNSHEKFIPDDYLWSSLRDRIDLVRGLMDTDGTIDARTGSTSLHTTSERLAADFRLLVESLGGTTSKGTAATESYTHNGERRQGRSVHVVTFCLPNEVNPFSLPSKRKLVRPRTKYSPVRLMVSIERAGREEARCLRVTSADHLYVTERFIVTHNTLLAEAVAGETQVPFVFVDPGAFNNMFMGVGILKVKGLFRRMRKLALRYGGVVTFFDEADSLGNRGALSPGGIFGPGGNSCRGPEYVSQSLDTIDIQQHRMMMGGMMGGGGMGTLQSLLSEMQGLTKPRGFINRYVRRALGMRPKPPPKYRILIIMATNMPQSLDEALLRPGRIDRIYKMGYPSKAGRIRTYQGYFAKVHNDLTPAQIERLATMTPYATGATIKDLVNESLINAIRDGRDVITWGDVVKAKHLKELGPPEDVEYIERERHATALHEACHAVTMARSKTDYVIDLATIEKGNTYLGMVKPVRAEDTFTRWKSDYEADIMVSLASIAGERFFFRGDSASGVSGDLSNATLIATFMEGYWGMGSSLASHEITDSFHVGGGGGGGRGGQNGRQRRDPTKELFESLGGRIEANLKRLLAQTEQLVQENRYEILGVAHALESRKTITGEDVQAIILGTPGPFVDGRVYQDPAFRATLEAYHEAALTAHTSRGTVEIPFPRVPEFAETAVGANGETAASATRSSSGVATDAEAPSAVATDGETPQPS
jgi:ATP-dependent Zn protease